MSAIGSLRLEAWLNKSSLSQLELLTCQSATGQLVEHLVYTERISGSNFQAGRHPAGFSGLPSAAGQDQSCVSHPR